MMSRGNLECFTVEDEPLRQQVIKETLFTYETMAKFYKLEDRLVHQESKVFDKTAKPARYEETKLMSGNNYLNYQTWFLSAD